MFHKLNKQIPVEMLRSIHASTTSNIGCNSPSFGTPSLAGPDRFKCQSFKLSAGSDSTVFASRLSVVKVQC